MSDVSAAFAEIQETFETLEGFTDDERELLVKIVEERWAVSHKPIHSMGFWFSFSFLFFCLSFFVSLRLGFGVHGQENELERGR